MPQRSFRAVRLQELRKKRGLVGGEGLEDGA